MSRALLSPSQAARELCISEKQLRLLTDAGAIRYINLGLGSVRAFKRYDPADLEAFRLAQLPPLPAPPPPPVEPDPEGGWPATPILPAISLPDYASCGVVYFIAAGGKVKIGRAISLKARMNQLRSGSPYPLHLVRFEPGGDKEERRYHKRFAAHRDRLEWFRLEGTLLDFLRPAVESGGI